MHDNATANRNSYTSRVASNQPFEYRHRAGSERPTLTRVGLVLVLLMGFPLP